jgi:hypothetical protein
VSRLCDRVTRRASPGLDTDLSDLGLGFIHPGDVRFSSNTLSDLFDLRFFAFSTRQIYLSSVTGNARDPFGSGKLFGVRPTTAAAATRDLPTALRTKSRFTVSPTSGSSVHFASNSSSRPPVSTTKSTLRVRSRQKKRLPVRPPRRSRSRSWAKTNVSQTARKRTTPRRLAEKDRV